jgi:hypothetical protein
MIVTKRQVSEINRQFTHHGRRYYLFSVYEDPSSFLYFCRLEGLPLRSLIFGDDFDAALPSMMKDESICIECGLGAKIKGGISVDGDMLVEFTMTREQANQLLDDLRRLLPEDDAFLQPFS